MAKSGLKLPTSRALSVWQPWAWLLCHYKDVENRSWKTKYRGPLLIHASKTKQFFEEDRRLIREQFEIDIPPASELAFGAIVGWGDLYNCRYSKHGDGNWGLPDFWHWMFRAGQPLPNPIYCRGYQRIFTVKL